MTDRRPPDSAPNIEMLEAQLETLKDERLVVSRRRSDIERSISETESQLYHARMAERIAEQEPHTEEPK